MARNKSILFLVSILTLVFASSLFADVRWYDGNPDDHYWGNAYNWGAIGRVPNTSDGVVYIKAGLSAQYGRPVPGSDPIINATEPNIASLYIGDAAAGLAEVTIIDGGKIDVMTKLRLGQYLTTPYTPRTHGRLNMLGGTLNVLGTGTTGGIDVGYNNTIGTINMTDGVLNTPTLFMRGINTANSNSWVELAGGTLNVGTGGIVWTQGYLANGDYRAFINITEGTLKVNKAITASDFSRGWIKAYEGLSTCNIDTTSQPGYTIVTANPYYKAYSPTPANAASIAAGDVASTILKWKAGTGATLHDVYLGSNQSLVAAGDQSVYMGSFAAVEFDPNGLENLSYETTFYWRVDEFDGTNTTIGNVWTFTVASNILPEMASQPVPANGATGVSRLGSVSWTAGVGAVSHDVYFGTNAALVNAGDSSVYKGNFATATFDYGTLAANTTYYWRVDELDGTNIWQGVVWSFTTRAPSGDIVWIEGDPGNKWSTATNWNALVVPNVNYANVYVRPGLTSEYPVIDIAAPDIHTFYVGRTDGSGHGWFTIEAGGSLKVTGDRLRLGHYLPANYQKGSAIINGGSLVVEKEFQVGIHSSDAVLTITGGDVSANYLNVAAGTYSTGYVNLNGGTLTVGSGGLVLSNEPAADRMRFAKMDIGAGMLVLAGDKVSSINYMIAQGHITAYGSANGGLLGEPTFITGGHPDAELIVNFDSGSNTTIVVAQLPDPKQAKNPVPANSATDVGLLSTLSWTAGQGATSHTVYFGTDEQLVIDGDTSVNMGSQASTTFAPGNLDSETVYYWRVDEFDGTATTIGNIWSFTTGTGQIIEDFESYADNSALAAVWTAGGGAVISVSSDALGAAATKSMKVNFAGATSSVTRTFINAQDWTMSNIASLMIPFHGVSTNSVTQLSVTLEDSFGVSATVIYGNTFMNQSPQDIIRAAYRPYAGWRVDLALFGNVDLSKVKKLKVTIGDGAAVSIGTVYFDNIGVYVPLCLPALIAADITGDCLVDMADLDALASNWLAADSTVTALAPQADGLIAHWNFDGDATDSAGSYDGAATNVSWDSTGGYDGGGCAVFNGTARISISGAETMFIDVTDQVTISVWVRGDENYQPMSSAVFAGGDALYMGHNPFVYLPESNGDIIFDAGHVSVQDPEWASYFYGWDRVTWSDNQFSDWAGQWVHYAFVKDAAQGVQRIYRNGELVAESLGAFVSMEGTMTFTIGALDRGTYQSMQYRGKIDDMRIYSTALPQEQIVALAAKASVEQPLLTPADGNQDGVVNIGDFAEVAAFWMKEVAWPY